MFYHLQANHDNEYSEIAPKKKTEDLPSNSKSLPLSLTPKQGTIKSCFDSTKPYPHQSSRYQHCENAVIDFICKDLQPLSVVDSPAFVSLVGTLDPCFQPPSRSTVTRALIPKKYQAVKEVVLSCLTKANYCSLTTDLWTGCHRKSYMTVTAHYITSDWEMKHHCLQTREIDENYNAENLTKELSAPIEEWELNDKVKVYGCTTDNAGNITNAIVHHLHLVHLPYVGHTLQLGVEKGLQVPQVARVLGRCKKLVEHFHKSTQETYALREKQRLLSDDPTLELIQSCPTRWGSTYLMLERIKKLQQPLCAVLLDKPREVRSLLPDGDEWNIIEEVLEVLKPFHRATTTMSASSYPTVSMLSLLLYKLKFLVLKVSEEDSPATKQLKQTILMDLQCRYLQDISALLDISAFLDPHFKDLDPFVAITDRVDIEEAVKLEILELVEDRSESSDDIDIIDADESDETDQLMKETNNEQHKEIQDQETSSSEVVPPAKKQKGAVSSLFSDLFKAKTNKK